MKKLVLSLCGALFLLSGCSNGGVDEDALTAVDKNQNIRQVCIKGSTRGAPDDFMDNLIASLKKKNIIGERVKDNRTVCNHILSFSAKGNRNIIARARLRILSGINNQPLGSVSYKLKGEEKDRVAQVGLQGQTDLMVNQLFKNY